MKQAFASIFFCICILTSISYRNKRLNCINIDGRAEMGILGNLYFPGECTKHKKLEISIFSILLLFACTYMCLNA